MNEQYSDRRREEHKLTDLDPFQQKCFRDFFVATNPSICITGPSYNETSSKINALSCTTKLQNPANFDQSQSSEAQEKPAAKLEKILSKKIEAALHDRGASVGISSPVLAVIRGCENSKRPFELYMRNDRNLKESIPLQSSKLSQRSVSIFGKNNPRSVSTTRSLQTFSQKRNCGVVETNDRDILSKKDSHQQMNVLMRRPLEKDALNIYNPGASPHFQPVLKNSLQFSLSSRSPCQQNTKNRVLEAARKEEQVQNLKNEIFALWAQIQSEESVIITEASLKEGELKTLTEENEELKKEVFELSRRLTIAQKELEVGLDKRKALFEESCRKSFNNLEKELTLRYKTQDRLTIEYLREALLKRKTPNDHE